MKLNISTEVLRLVVDDEEQTVYEEKEEEEIDYRKLLEWWAAEIKQTYGKQNAVLYLRSSHKGP